jgi:outer membrane protein
MEVETVRKKSQSVGGNVIKARENFIKKMETALEKEKEMGELMKKTLIKEITALEVDLKNYQNNGTKLMQLNQNELMRPLYKLINDSINAVAKENKYSQVLTSTGNQFVYIDDNFDITKLVIAKLGLTEPELKN